MANTNCKSFIDIPLNDLGGGSNTDHAHESFSLTRQPTVYSLTFDEFQSTMGGVGKDFGSMNMDELLKNIWNAEETQMVATAAGALQEGTNRQSSLALPRTLSQKTVDEVWKDITKEHGSRPVSSGVISHRQQTLGEMTLEEFLVRAGVVREETELENKSHANGGLFGDLLQPESNSNLVMGFPHSNGIDLSGSTSNQACVQPSNVISDANFIRSSQVLAPTTQQQHMISKQAPVGLVAPISLQSGQDIRSGLVAFGDQALDSALVQAGGIGVGFDGVTRSPTGNQLSPDGFGNNVGEASASITPYMFNGSLRGRRTSGTVEKVAERRQRRMIKNRESAARSRARKQAYTMELEAEVAKLKEENEELRRRQAQIIEIEKHQRLRETKSLQHGVRNRPLRRTHTSPL